MSTNKTYNKVVAQIRANKNVSLVDFNIGKTVGKGTFGKVKIVTYKNDIQNNPFAMKILSKREIEKLKQINHIKSEKRVLGLIDFPFIYKLIKVFQNKDYICMIFEYVPGGEVF